MKYFVLFFFLPFFSADAQQLKLVDSISVFFGYNSYSISRPVITKDQLNWESIVITKIELKGYTDSIGAFSTNEQLAINRMKTVADKLQECGYTSDQMRFFNYNETTGTRLPSVEMNRRVDILFYGLYEEDMVEEPLEISPLDEQLEHSGQLVQNENETVVLEADKLINLHINFIGGSADFLPTAYSNLNEVFQFMKNNPDLKVELRGHVCCADDYVLSSLRAYAVSDYLTKRGISSKRISCKGFSNHLPLVPDDSEVHMSMNRRVEAVFRR